MKKKQLLKRIKKLEKQIDEISVHPIFKPMVQDKYVRTREEDIEHLSEIIRAYRKSKCSDVGNIADRVAEKLSQG